MKDNEENKGGRVKPSAFYVLCHAIFADTPNYLKEHVVRRVKLYKYQQELLDRLMTFGRGTVKIPPYLGKATNGIEKQES